MKKWLVYTVLLVVFGLLASQNGCVLEQFEKFAPQADEFADTVQKEAEDLF